METEKISMVARLCEVQKKIEAENMPLSSPCGEWCKRCLCVSETEFVQIVDFLLNNFAKEEILKIIRESKRQMNMLEKERPETAEKIKGTILLKDLLKLDKTELPFSCVFCDERDGCMIEKVRPLKCRTAEHGEAEERADFEKDIYSFIFLKKDDAVIIRRPEPLFYYFAMIFRDERELDEIREAAFFRGILSLDEAAYISELCGG